MTLPKTSRVAASKPFFWKPYPKGLIEPNGYSVHWKPAAALGVGKCFPSELRIGQCRAARLLSRETCGGETVVVSAQLRIRLAAVIRSSALL